MYTSYDTPNEFFNTALSGVTASGYVTGTGTVTFGTASHGTTASKFLTNLTDAQASTGETNPTIGRTSQVIFAVVDAIYQRFNAIRILDAANAPTKFNITRTGYTDETTGEIVYNYAITCRVTPGSLVAVNS